MKCFFWKLPNLRFFHVSKSKPESYCSGWKGPMVLELISVSLTRPSDQTIQVAPDSKNKVVPQKKSIVAAFVCLWITWIITVLLLFTQQSCLFKYYQVCQYVHRHVSGISLCCNGPLKPKSTIFLAQDSASWKLSCSQIQMKHLLRSHNRPTPQAEHWLRLRPKNHRHRFQHARMEKITFILNNWNEL